MNGGKEEEGHGGAIDGELSFSSWRRALKEDHPLSQPQPPLSASSPSPSPSSSSGSLTFKRGINLAITPIPHNSQEIRREKLSEPDGKLTAPEDWESIPFDENSSSPFLISDEAFERDFNFSVGSPPAPAKKDSSPRSRFPENKLSVMGSLKDRSFGSNHGFGPINGSHNGPDADDDDEEEMELIQAAAANNTLVPTNSIVPFVIRTLLYILIWYFFSTSLTLYNKKLLGAKLWDFPTPLLMNTIHFSMQALISSFVLRFVCRSLRPSVQISWKQYFTRVVPAAVATALDIDLTNASLVYITVSFETMCKSAAPVFLLLFAFIFKLETPSLKLFGIIFVISGGVLLTGVGSLFDSDVKLAKEQGFQLHGFILVILAAVMSGFRWTVTQILLQKKEFGLNNPFAVMNYLAPVMAVFTLVFSLASEPWHKLADYPFFDNSRDIIRSSLILLLGGSLAFFMVLAEYLLISKTSAVTFTVAGVVKEVVTILVAVMFFGDRFTILKAIGLAVIMSGVAWFNWFKFKKIMSGNGDEHGSNDAPVQYIPLESKEKSEVENDLP